MMKNKWFILITLCLLNIDFVNSQTQENSYYISLNGYGGNYLGLETAANFNSKSNYTVKLSGSIFFKQIIFNTKEIIYNYNLSGGKTINLDSKEKIKLRLIGGVGLSSIIENRYSERYEVINFIVNPVIEFRLLPFYGLSVAPVLILNKQYTMIGIGFGSMLGYLRRFPERGEN